MRNLFVLSSKMEALASIMLNQKYSVDEGSDRMLAFAEDELHLTEKERLKLFTIALPLVYKGMAQDELECTLTLAFSRVMFDRTQRIHA